MSRSDEFEIGVVPHQHMLKFAELTSMERFWNTHGNNFQKHGNMAAARFAWDQGGSKSREIGELNDPPRKSGAKRTGKMVGVKERNVATREWEN